MRIGVNTSTVRGIGCVLVVVAVAFAMYSSAQNAANQDVTRTVTSGNLVSAPTPQYPPLARSARIQGTVVLKGTVGTDGTVKGLQVVSGHPFLVKAAIEAVENWKYQPYLKDGKPVEVDTQMVVSFRFDGVTAKDMLAGNAVQPISQASLPSQKESEKSQTAPRMQSATANTAPLPRTSSSTNSEGEQNNIKRLIQSALSQDEEQNCSNSPNPDCRSDFRKGIKYKRVVLSPSGETGQIVECTDMASCGSGGCNVYVLRQSSDGYEKVLDILGSSSDLLLSKTVTNGFYEITRRTGLATSTINGRYSWTGSKYSEVRSNPTASAKQNTTGDPESFARSLTTLYVQRLRENGADPNRTFFRVETMETDKYLGLVIETNTIALPANAQSFIQNAGWVSRSYAVGFRAIRLYDGRTACDFKIQTPTSIRPGICFTQWMEGASMRQEVVREWPQGYVFIVR